MSEKNTNILNLCEQLAGKAIAKMDGRKDIYRIAVSRGGSMNPFWLMVNGKSLQVFSDGSVQGEDTTTVERLLRAVTAETVDDEQILDALEELSTPMYKVRRRVQEATETPKPSVENFGQFCKPATVALQKTIEEKGGTLHELYVVKRNPEALLRQPGKVYAIGDQKIKVVVRELDSTHQVQTAVQSYERGYFLGIKFLHLPEGETLKDIDFPQGITLEPIIPTEMLMNGVEGVQ